MTSAIYSRVVVKSSKEKTNVLGDVSKKGSGGGKEFSRTHEFTITLA